ncbi:uncharacterized protein At4g13200, chloroplastic [Cornus florida]|uniref:uncharacterized protein At4g13200, chloroplastic n=1 Tax=Cornus florida TaxID=4283 RepID=UPI0028998730|nr:uncharacterized protein At4g13200, chloroplastic [Cornus florida]
MSGSFSASPPSAIYSGSIQSKTQISRCINRSWRSSVPTPPLSRDYSLFSSDFKLKPVSFRCNGSTRPGGPGPGENDPRSVLDAFFLGKALAEALSERIESTVGEFLSSVGRLQAEQQKQVVDFQEEVLERAKKAKERAAREAIEAQGLIPTSSTGYSSKVSDSVTSTPEPTADDAAAPAISLSSNSNDSPTETNPDPIIGVSNDD